MVCEKILPFMRQPRGVAATHEDGLTCFVFRFLKRPREDWPGREKRAHGPLWPIHGVL
jgi:hypothetical protein